MNYNVEAAEFEINRLQENQVKLLRDKHDLIKALRLLQSECVNRDSSVTDSDAFIESRCLLTKMNIS